MSACGLCNDKNIVVIRGDVLEVYFEIEGVEPEAISHVYFRSSAADICVELPYSNLRKAYCLRLESATTDEFTPVIGSYDLVIELIDGNIITGVHEGGFTILKKRNAFEDEGGL